MKICEVKNGKFHFSGWKYGDECYHGFDGRTTGRGRVECVRMDGWMVKGVSEQAWMGYWMGVNMDTSE